MNKMKGAKSSRLHLSLIIHLNDKEMSLSKNENNHHSSLLFE
jgi:hypothetical protein